MSLWIIPLMKPQQSATWLRNISNLTWTVSYVVWRFSNHEMVEWSLAQRILCKFPWSFCLSWNRQGIYLDCKRAIHQVLVNSNRGWQFSIDTSCAFKCHAYGISSWCVWCYFLWERCLLDNLSKCLFRRGNVQKRNVNLLKEICVWKCKLWKFHHWMSKCCKWKSWNRCAKMEWFLVKIIRSTLFPYWRRLHSSNLQIRLSILSLEIWNLMVWRKSSRALNTNYNRSSRKDSNQNSRWCESCRNEHKCGWIWNFWHWLKFLWISLRKLHKSENWQHQSKIHFPPDVPFSPDFSKAFEQFHKLNS